jgi:hypothetical protein
MFDPRSELFAQPPAPPSLDVVADVALADEPAKETQKRADFRLFVDRNPDKFLPVFDAMEGGRGGAFVCWPGLFFPQAWFLYRKLYGWAAVSCVLPILVATFHIGGDFQRAFASAPAFIALAGRRLYVANARRTIARIREVGSSEEEALQSIRRAGGVSTPGAVLGGLIFIASVVAGFMAAQHAAR